MTELNQIVFLESEHGGDAVRQSLKDMKAQNIVPRMWLYDHNLWGDKPDEISNRLGWLHISQVMRVFLPRLDQFVRAAREDRFSHAVLLGMGGSSLAPEVYRQTFGVADGFLDLSVLDSTDPGTVASLAEQLDPERTLFIVSTKSGGTVETLSFFKYFYNRVAQAVGEAQAGRHFIAITDPASSLTGLAREYGFREVFLNDPNIGGRYSALSYFGLVPAALIGVDLPKLLQRAITMAMTCGPQVAPAENPGALLGALLGASAANGRDKATFVIAEPIGSFGDWVEQLLAESTGKQGKGILPVVREPLAGPAAYGDNDRLFIDISLGSDIRRDERLQHLEAGGQPVLHLPVADVYDLGGQFLLWEMATAVAGHLLGINPFDQPNVEAAKVQARRLVESYRASGRLTIPAPTMDDGQLAAYVPESLPLSGPFACPGDVLQAFVKLAKPGDYVALQAYLQPTPAVTAMLQTLRRRLLDHVHLATTVGYGPRFLHSTGQLHKGDAGNGLFVQLTSDAGPDLPIPDKAGQAQSSISFGTLKMAQALGDQQALLDAGRRVVRFHLKEPVEDLEYLADCL